MEKRETGMKKSSNKITYIFFALLLFLSVFSGCENVKNLFDKSNSDRKDSKNTDEYEEFLTVDIFCANANYQGIQAGWFGKVVKDKFNMELNIIAPNVAGGGDTLFQTRSAAGNLGDIVMIGANSGKLADTVTAGLLLDLSDYVDLMPNAMQYVQGVEMLQNLVGDNGGIYALPSSVSSYPATEPAESTEPTYGPYLRWDLYMQIGAPRIETIEELLPVLKQMQMISPQTDSGEKVYGFSLFKDWDGNMMMMGKQPACLYGFDEIGFVLSKADGKENQSIIDDDSLYVRSLKLYFQANQMGLLDPESATQNWDAVWDKTAAGAVLYSPWPWLGQAAFNTNDNLAAGKGFMIAPVEDIKIFSYGARPSGDKYVVGIGSKAQDPERMAAFIDWLYSPEGIMMSTSQTGSTCGPEGLTWEMAEGEPVLTEFGVKAMLQGGVNMPEEWGGESWEEGVSQLNFQPVMPKDINPETGFSYDFRLWDSYVDFTSTPVHESWENIMGATTTFEYLVDNDMLIVAPGTDFIAPAEPAEIERLRDQCKEIIVKTSWKMVFAEDEEQFYTLLHDMQDTVNELGYEDVLKFDLEAARAQSAAREAASAGIDD